MIFAQEGQFLFIGYVDPVHLAYVLLAARKIGLVVLLALSFNLVFESKSLNLFKSFFVVFLESIISLLQFLKFALVE